MHVNHAVRPSVFEVKLHIIIRVISCLPENYIIGLGARQKNYFLLYPSTPATRIFRNPPVLPTPLNNAEYGDFCRHILPGPHYSNM